MGRRPEFGARRRVAALAAVLALALPAVSRAGECPPGNLVPAARIEGAGVRGLVRAVADGYVADEGAPWDSPLAAVLAGPGAFVDVDLGEVRALRSLAVQADGEDAYAVDGSLDGVAFFPVCRLRPVAGGGLRTRTVDLGGVRTRHLRVRGVRRDGRHSIAEIEAACSEPGAAPAAAAPGPPRRGWLTPRRVAAVKLAVALLAALLFAWGWHLRRAGRAEAHRALRDRALLGLGVAGVVCWFNLGAFHFGNFLHPGELFHYFLGAKYFPELGYDGLYRCAAVADADAGLEGWVRERSFRDLATRTRLVPGAELLAGADECRRRFSPERWRAFTLDLAWFRSWIPPGHWERTTQDHGYNGSPAWWLAGSLLTRRLPASDAAALALAMIDPLLLAGALALIVWAFGPQAAAVAAIWWGTNLPADFSWTGGGFLRQDWLFLAVAGVCLVRKERWAAGGAAIAWAALLRVYPVFLAAGLGARALVSLAQRRSPSLEPGQRRFAAGFLAAAALLGLLSSAASPEGAASWKAFVDDGRALLAAGATNHVGLAPLLSFDPDALLRKVSGASFDERVASWRAGRERVLASRLALRAAAVLAFAGLLLARVRAVADWEALVLGVGAIPFAVASSSYYASVYLLYGVLWVRWRERAALPLVALAGLTQAGGLLWGQPLRQEELFAWVSLCLLALAVRMTALRRA